MIPLNIALIPPTDISQEAIKLSQSLKQHGGLFTLGKHKNMPHISLYATSFPEQNLSKIQNELQTVTKKIQPIPLLSSHYAVNHDVWIAVNYTPTPALLALQKSIIDALHQFTPQSEFYNAGFGIDMPHITFTKLKTPQVDILTTLPARNFDFMASQLGLFESGEHGTCKRLIAQFPLKLK